MPPPDASTTPEAAVDAPPGAGCDVSVVVPAYRAVPFVATAVRSALGQSGVELEVVVVDDACPDATGDFVERELGHDPRVTVLRLGENLGPAGARNVGFAAARGRWVAVLDADDTFDDGRLARLLAQTEGREVDVVADNVRFRDAASEQLSDPQLGGLTGPTPIDARRFVSGARPGTGTLDLGLLKPVFRRSFLTDHGLHYPQGVRHGEDFLFVLDVLLAGGRFWLLPEPGYRWTVRSSSTSSRTSVDYLGQAATTRTLHQRPEIAADAELVALLERRATALERRHEVWHYTRLTAERRYAAALLWCLRHPHLLRIPLASVRHRLPGRPGGGSRGASTGSPSPRGRS